MQNEKELIDFVTGKPVANIGAEANRQAVERYLVDEKGYLKSDIAVDLKIEFPVAGDVYQSRIDLVVSVDGRQVMVIKCAAGSLDSRQKEVVSAARVLGEYRIPFSVASDGQTAIIYDAVAGKKIGEGLQQIPAPDAARERLRQFTPVEVSADRLERDRLVFRSYDSMNVNVSAT